MGPGVQNFPNRKTIIFDLDEMCLTDVQSKKEHNKITPLLVTWHTSLISGFQGFGEDPKKFLVQEKYDTHLCMGLGGSKIRVGGVAVLETRGSQYSRVLSTASKPES